MEMYAPYLSTWIVSSSCIGLGLVARYRLNLVIATPLTYLGATNSKDQRESFGYDSGSQSGVCTTRTQLFCARDQGSSSRCPRCTNRKQIHDDSSRVFKSLPSTGGDALTQYGLYLGREAAGVKGPGTR